MQIPDKPVKRMYYPLGDGAYASLDVGKTKALAHYEQTTGYRLTARDMRKHASKGYNLAVVDTRPFWWYAEPTIADKVYTGDYILIKSIPDNWISEQAYKQILDARVQYVGSNNRKG